MEPTLGLSAPKATIWHLGHLPSDFPSLLLLRHPQQPIPTSSFDFTVIPRAACFFKRILLRPPELCDARFPERFLFSKVDVEMQIISAVHVHIML
jgi:hypothetical protein